MRWYTMIDSAKKANYKYAFTDGTISDFTAEALRDVKGHSVPGYIGRSGFAGDRTNDIVDIPFSVKRGSTSSNHAGGSRREPDGSLTGLPHRVKVGDDYINASHWQPAEDVAMAYMDRAGLPYNPPSTYAKVDPDRATRIAEEYDKMKHDPFDPEVRAAYRYSPPGTASGPVDSTQGKALCWSRPDSRSAISRHSSMTCSVLYTITSDT